MTKEQAAYDIATLPGHIAMARFRLRTLGNVDSQKVSREEIRTYTARLEKARAFLTTDAA